MKHRLLDPVVVLIITAGLTGCAAKPTAPQAQRPAVVPIEQRTLAQLDPLTERLEPSTAPAPTASADALQLYAQGRDALLRNQRPIAIEKLEAAIALDPTAALLHSELAFALLATDQNRALAQYGRAAELNPEDAEVRLQMGRIFLLKNQPDLALIQLRLAKASAGYKEHPVTGAMIDLLLSRVLEQKSYFTAAIECLEAVVPVVEERSFQARARPELAEIVARPVVLQLRIAELAAKAEQYDRAISIYTELQEVEPNAAAGLKLRVAQVYAAQGKLDEAAAEVLELVRQFDAGRTSVQAYRDLFIDKGGDGAALRLLRRHMSAEQDISDPFIVLEAQLLLNLQRPSEAADALKRLNTAPTLAAVRTTVESFRAVGRHQELPKWLLREMTRFPDSWPAIARGWAILTAVSQASPLELSGLRALEVPDDLAAAKAFVSAEYAGERGQPVLAKRLGAQAGTLNGPLVRRWLASQQRGESPDIDFSSLKDVTRFIEEMSNDPQYLSAGLGLLVRQGRKDLAVEALESVVQRQPSNVTAAVQLAGVYLADERKADALRLADATAKAVSSASQLYQIAALMTQLGETAASERILRRSHELDPNHPATCNDLGYMLADEGRELDFAEKLLWRAVGAEPDNPAYVDSLGWLLYKRGKFAEASQYLEQAVQASEPPDAVVLDHAGDAAHRVGQIDRAKQHWKQAVDMLRQRTGHDPQLRLRVEQKLRQLETGADVGVAPAEAK